MRISERISMRISERISRRISKRMSKRIQRANLVSKSSKRVEQANPAVPGQGQAKLATVDGGERTARSEEEKGCGKESVILLLLRKLRKQVVV